MMLTTADLIDFNDLEELVDQRKKQVNKILLTVAVILPFFILMTYMPAAYAEKPEPQATKYRPRKKANQKQQKAPLTLPADVAVQPDFKNWGLIIGIENYERLPKVEYAGNDARAVREYFINLLGIPESQTFFLLDKNADKAEIDHYLKDYIPKNAGKQSNLYVYFVGHGMLYLKNNAPYLVLYNSDPRYLEQTGYKLSSFYQSLYQLPINRVCVFLDSCFSGPTSGHGAMGKKATPSPLEQLKDVPMSVNTIISFNAASKEQVNNAYPEKEFGLFSFYLLRGLKGDADMNQDRWVDMFELYKFTYKNIVRESRRMASEQTPVIISSSDQWKDVKICRYSR